MKYNRIIAVVVVVCLAAATVQAQTVNIKNGSFETPDASDGSFPFLVDSPGSNWDGPGATVQAGVWQPLIYMATPAPDGLQVTYNQFDGSTMAQTLEWPDSSAVAASSGDIFVVSMMADNRLSGDPASIVDDMLLDLVAPDNSNVFASVIGGSQGIGLAQVPGYNLYSTSLTIAGGLGEREGKQMTLQIIVSGLAGQANLDLVSMELIPEPSSMVLALVSLGGLGLLRRKR